MMWVLQLVQIGAMDASPNNQINDTKQQIIAIQNCYSFIQPSYPPSFFPDTSFCNSLHICKLSFPVLFPLEPVPIILPHVSPSIYPLALFKVLNIFPSIASSISPIICTISMHFTSLPSSYILPTILPRKYSLV